MYQVNKQPFKFFVGECLEKSMFNWHLNKHFRKTFSLLFFADSYLNCVSQNSEELDNFTPMLHGRKNCSNCIFLVLLSVRF
jgi:hypothetical protein